MIKEVIEDSYELTFNVNYPTKFGEFICIIGNIPELGQWKLSNSLQLKTSKEGFPHWKNAEPLRLKSLDGVEFKAIKCIDNKILEWESGSNKKLCNKMENSKRIAICWEQGKPNLRIVRKVNAKIDENKHNSPCYLHFRVQYYTNFSEKILILGNIPQLGNWKVSAGLALTTNHTTYPIWHSSQPIQLEEKQQIEFKVVKVDAHNNVLQWDQVSGNRKYTSRKNRYVTLNFASNSQIFKEYEQFTQNIRTDIEKIYIEQLFNDRIRMVNIIDDFSSNDKNIYVFVGAAKGSATSNYKIKSERISQEIQMLSKNLPLNLTNSIFLAIDEKRIDIMKVLIFGAENTPYAHGAFTFDLFIPDSYPKVPPQMNITSTGYGSVKFNPNLYSTGYICLSLLGTFSGSGNENWNSQTSNLFQLFQSIQSLVMSDDVFYNESGHYSYFNTVYGMKNNRGYQNIVKYANVVYAMTEAIKNPPVIFKDIILTHFIVKKNIIIQTIDKWIIEAQECSNTNTSYDGIAYSQNISISQKFKSYNEKYYYMLKDARQSFIDEINKISV